MEYDFDDFVEVPLETEEEMQAAMEAEAEAPSFQQKASADGYSPNPPTPETAKRLVFDSFDSFDSLDDVTREVFPSDVTEEVLAEADERQLLVPPEPRCQEGARGVLHRPPSDGTDCIMVIGKEGQVRYVTLAPAQSDSDDEEEPPSHKRGSIKGISVNQLRQAMSDRQMSSTSVATDEQGKAEESRATSATKEMLVDKYSPQKYRDLLSDEDVNLQVLTWFRGWDDCVYGKKGVAGKDEKEKEAKGDPRPTPRVLFLSGPPGAGKTTLAKVVAHHCGYDPFHVNASMDRTASQLDERVQACCTGMATLTGKPSCLILDEVDGIASAGDGGVLRSMVDLCQRPWGGSQQKEEKGRRRRREAAIQRRPIVCICNNPWVPTLRGLRDIALFLQVPAVQPAKLSKRLSLICNLEQVTADPTALQELSLVSDGDIRNCLFTLQFLSLRKGKRLGRKELLQGGVGRKDHVVGVLNVLDFIFDKNDKAAQKMLMQMPHIDMAQYRGVSPSTVYVKALLTSHPETEKLFEGCFERYLNSSYHDYDLRQTARLLKTISGLLCFERVLGERGMFGAKMGYEAQKILFFHQICQATRYQRVKNGFPHSFAQHHMAKEKSVELIESYINAPARLASATRRDVALDVVPYLLCAINPPLKVKGASSHLISAEDHEVLSRLQALHIHNNVTYQPRKEGLATVWEMVPNLACLVRYAGAQLPYFDLATVWRMQIAKAVKDSAIRDTAEAKSAQSGPPTKDSTPQITTGAGKKKVELPEHVSNPGLLVPKKGTRGSTATVKMVRDIFGRVMPAKKREEATAKKPKKEAEPTEPPDAAPGKRPRPPSPPRNDIDITAPSPSFADGKGLRKHKMFRADVGVKFQLNSGFTNAVRVKSLFADWM